MRTNSDRDNWQCFLHIPSSGFNIRWWGGVVTVGDFENKFISIQFELELQSIDVVKTSKNHIENNNFFIEHLCILYDLQRIGLQTGITAL